MSEVRKVVTVTKDMLLHVTKDMSVTFASQRLRHHS
jgi:hypothetical protein